MNPLRRPSCADLRTLCAKLVIAASVVVALATSAPPTWVVTEVREVELSLTDGGSRELLLTLELAGPLYADTEGSELSVLVAADRAASDLTLSMRRLEPVLPEEVSDPPAPDFFPGNSRDAGAADAGLANSDVPTLSASPDPAAPSRVGLTSALACVESTRRERAESCRERVQLRLSRLSRQTVNVTVHVELTLDGGKQKQPPGTFELDVVEAAP